MYRHAEQWKRDKKVLNVNFEIRITQLDSMNRKIYLLRKSLFLGKLLWNIYLGIGKCECLKWNSMIINTFRFYRFIVRRWRVSSDFSFLANIFWNFPHLLTCISKLLPRIRFCETCSFIFRKYAKCEKICRFAIFVFNEKNCWIYSVKTRHPCDWRRKHATE